MSKPSKEVLLALLNQQRTFGEISRELCVNKEDLRDLFKIYNLPTPLAFARSKISREYLENCIKSGLSLKTISNNLRLDFRDAKRILDSFNLQTDQQKRWHDLQNLRKTGLSEKAKGVIIGTLLGDSCVSYVHNYGKACNLSFKHSELQKDYARYKAKVLLSEVFQQENPVIIPGSDLKISGIETHAKTQYKWSSITHDYFYWIRETAYDKIGCKTITEDLLKDLTLLGAAVWFADDGSVGNNKTYRIATNGFSLESLKLLRHWLFKNVEIKSTIIKSKIGYELYIPRNSVKNFELYIGSWVRNFPDVAYKIKGFDV